jgi:hypothetical protein
VIALVCAAVALVADDGTQLRAAPRASSAIQARLSRGDWLEVRGETPGWLKVYDRRRERPGYVRPAEVRVHGDGAEEAPALRAVIAFLRDAPSYEPLGIAYVALWQRTGSREGAAEVEDALGAMADRLAERIALGVGRPSHRETAQEYGVRYVDVDRGGRVVPCYDGDAWRRVLTIPGATPAQRARAALGLTRAGCLESAAGQRQIASWQQWRLEVLAQVDDAPPPLGEQIRLRRAEALAHLAWWRAQKGEDGSAAAAEAIRQLALVDAARLGDGTAARDAAALRVAASRFAAEKSSSRWLRIAPGRPGETCVSALGIERCTYGQVWAGSARASREVVVVAVQPLPAWTELWVFTSRAGKGRVAVLPPAAADPEVGYVDAAGISADGTRIAVVREALVGGRLFRRFQMVRSRDLRVLSSAREAALARGFTGLASASWMASALALR